MTGTGQRGVPGAGVVPVVAGCGEGDVAVAEGADDLPGVEGAVVGGVVVEGAVVEGVVGEGLAGAVPGEEGVDGRLGVVVFGAHAAKVVCGTNTMP
jgi:hypothetical protein